MLYFSRYDPAHLSVHQKIMSQISNLKKHGIDTHLIYFGFQPEFCLDLDYVTYHPIEPANQINVFGQIKIQNQIIRIIDGYRDELNPGDVLYVRFLGPNPFYLFFLMKVILDRFEHQSIEPLEIKFHQKSIT